MNQTFHASQKIGDIVTAMSHASDIFKEYRIDFCCGGNRPLREALEKQNLNEQEVLDKLNKAYEELKERKDRIVDFSQLSSELLIDYIVETHHDYLKGALPKLAELTAKILRVHGKHHDVLFQVHRLFNLLKMELEAHLIKEEEILFPLITDLQKKDDEATRQKIARFLKETEDEHEAAGNILKELRAITHDFQAPADACGSYRLTFQKLEELEADLFQHIHLENNILFLRV